jgi:hypothetical protein
MEPMRADWERQREAHRKELVVLLDSRDYRDFVEDYLDFTETLRRVSCRCRPGPRRWCAIPRLAASGWPTSGSARTRPRSPGRT